MNWLSEEDIGNVESNDIKKLLDDSFIDPDTQIDKPPIILSLKEQHGTQWDERRIFTLGNFSAIRGKKKSRKTFLLSLFAGSLLSEKSGRLVNDLPKDKKLVLYFDTEQGAYDSQQVMKRIQKLAGHKSHFKGFNLRPYDPLSRCKIIDTALSLWGKNVGFVVIDGIRDLVVSINDEPEATRVVTLLLKWTKDYNCHISVVIHENKATGDSRGHIGTEVENKSEIIISASKIKDDWRSSEITCEYSRGIGFEPFVMTIIDDLPTIEDGREKAEVKNQDYYESHIHDKDEPPF